MKPPINVFLADDDENLLAVYKKLFERSEGFFVQGVAKNGNDAAKIIEKTVPDVALLDIQMPGQSGLAILDELVSQGLSTRVLFLTTFDLDEYIAPAIELGAAGFLLKNAAPSEILSAVTAVHAGYAALAPEITARMMQRMSPDRPRHRNPLADQLLSHRQIELARLVADGLSNQEIAACLHLSNETVRTYLNRMFVKLGVKNRTELAIRAHEAGLLRETRR